MFNYCLILAAGQGIRLMPLTELVPKALIEVDEKPIIFHTISQVRSIIENLIVTVGYFGHDIASYVLKEGATMIIKTHMRGNAFWLFNSLLKDLNEPVLVLTCDNIVKLDFDWLKFEYSRLSKPACLIIPVDAVEGISGDYITGKNHIVSDLSIEHFDNNERNIYCSGIQIINPYIINKICEPTEDFNEVWQNLIRQNNLYYSDIYPHPWFSINTPQQLNQYHHQFKKATKIVQL